MKIAYKFPLLVAAFLAVLSFISVKYVRQLIEKSTFHQHIIEREELVSLESQLINFLQKERGKSVLYINNGIELSELDRQTEEVDSLLSKYFLKKDKWKRYILKDNVDKLNLYRQKVRNRSIDQKTVFNHYSAIVRGFLARYSFISSTLERSDHFVTLYRQQYVLEVLKENLGQVRAKISLILLRKNPLLKSELLDIFALKSSIDTNLANLNLFGSDAFNSDFTKLISSPQWSQVETVYNKIIAHDGDVTQFGQYSSKQYFEMSTNVIDNLNTIIQQKIRGLHNQSRDLQLKVNQELKLVALTLGLTVILLFIISFSTVRQFLLALRELKRGVKNISNGDFEGKIDIKKNNELGELASAFNYMIGQIQRGRKQLYLEKQAAEKASHAKSSFVTNMSHEIRTPLNALLGMIDVLADTKLTEEQKSYLEIVCKSGKSLTDVINKILDFSKIENGQVELEPQTFALDDLLNKICQMMEPHVRLNGSEIDFAIDPNVPGIIINDPIRLQQILLNLVGNAVKFTKGGYVNVKVERDLGRSDYLIFSVSDTGDGIPIKEQKNIFERFVQLDSEQKNQGTGLGLAIARELVRLMKGEIWFSSTPAVGATFYFTLKYQLPPVLSTLAKEQNSFKRMEQKTDISKILVVEDGPDNRLLIRSMLKKSGVNIDEATNGVEGHDKFTSQKEKYDLILMDMQMPVMDGLACTAKIRKWEKENSVKETPIVALSAHAFDNEIRKSMEVGCNDYLTKPISKDDLVELLSKYLS